MRNVANPCLIQIHYHNRAGGVTRVMESYADEFRNMYGSKSVNLILCHSEGKGRQTAAEIINIEDCDYHYFRSVEAFYKTRATIVRQIESVLAKKTSNFPVLIICHNLNLGKNPALSSAISLISRKSTFDKFRFFLVVHDMAEEGRADIIQKLRFFKRNKIDIKRDLFLVGSGAKILTLNTQVCGVLKECGFDVSVIPNPISYNFINKRSIPVKCMAWKNITEKEFRNFDQSKRTFYYPSRIIARKNVFESIALVNCILNGNLILGKTTDIVTGKNIKKRIEELTDKYKLPILTESERIFRSENDRLSLINNSDYFISTSISEGFGYALHEPWVYKKWLIGRKPKGFESSYGIDLQGLYDFLPVPSEWINVNELLKLYEAGYEKCFGPGRYTTEISKALRRKNIDFGMLNEKSQINVICLVNENIDMKSKWIEILQSPCKGWPGLDALISIDKNIISRNRRILKGADIIFKNKFRQYLNSNHNSSEYPDCSKLERAFFKIKKCPILMMAS